MNQTGNEVNNVPTDSISIRPLSPLAMLSDCTVCDSFAEFGIYRTVEGQEVLTAVVCREHTVRPADKEA